MRVKLIAATQTDAEALFKLTGGVWEPEPGATGGDTLAEWSGRACYQSWQRPNPATATNVGYLDNIIRSGHMSVLEHASATFYIEGVSRALTHELIRHRHLSYSQLSQRFVNESGREADPVFPPAADGDTFAESIHRAAHGKTHEFYNELVEHYQNNRGFSRKQAREAARAVLPNQQETKIVVTGNHRAWREVINRRIQPDADAEFQMLSKKLLRQLKRIAPATYQDMEESIQQEGALY